MDDGIPTPRLDGATCVVTGATSGIGLATARMLARLGGRVVAVGRDETRCLRAIELIAGEGGPEPRREIADLALLSEVVALSSRLLESAGPIRVLVNAAGAFTPRRRPTPEGLETQFAVNHLASFVLTRRLLPALRNASPARAIVVSSASHYPGRIRWRDPLMSGFYFGLWAYEQSKLANVLFVRELARRLGPDSGIDAYAADPGLANTDMGQKAGASPSAWFWGVRRRFGDPPEVPASAIARLASAPEFAGSSGRYWKDGAEKRPSRRALRDSDARRLWELSEDLCATALGRDKASIFGSDLDGRIGPGYTRG